MNKGNAMSRILSAAIALALASNAWGLSNSFSYQGSLTDGGTPANGSYDLQFQLQTSAGANVGAALVREDVSVAGGVFSVELDFGAAITSADFRLQIGVRPGASVGAFTTLAPTTPIRPTPQAQVAGIAAEAVTVSPNSITSAAIQDSAIRTSDIQDNTILSADIGDLQVGVNDVNFDEVQLRVANACAAGSAIRSIANNGTVTCVNVSSGGTVTSVTSGAGLSGGPITTTGTLSIATGGVTSAMIEDGTVANTDLAANAVNAGNIIDGTVANADLAANAVNAGNIVDGSVGSADVNTAEVQARVAGACAAGSSISTIAANGSVTCETDDGTGTVTSVASGAGLTGGPITSSGTLSIATGGVISAMIADGTVANADLATSSVNAGNIVDGSVGSADINTAQVQARVTGTCASGSSVSAIAANGTVTCESDDTGAPGWLLAGNTGTDSSVQFIGTTDDEALVLRVNNQRALTISPNLTSPNLTGGYSGNEVTPGVRGGTIAGGGYNTSENRVTDEYGTVGGGTNNVAGDGPASTVNRGWATVGGGDSNTASGLYSTVAGGIGNSASGLRSTVGGGISNNASAIGSTVAGGDTNTASGILGTVGGGNLYTASGYSSAVGGGSFNCAGGRISWAGGSRAKVRPGSTSGAAGIACGGIPSVGSEGDVGTFIWADSQNDDFVSTGPNQFLVRADGGVGINGTPATAGLEMNVFGATPFDGFVEMSLIPKPSLNGNTGERIEFGVGKGGAGSNDADLRIAHRNDSGGFFEHVSIDGDGSVIVRSNPANTAQGVQLAIGAGAWSTLSDRNLKTDIQSILPLDVLERLVAMPIQQWRYIGQPGEVQHIGPMAQDFAAAFGVGENDTTISTVDADGVALAAIQGLNQKLETENAALREEIAALRALVMARVENRQDAQ